MQYDITIAKYWVIIVNYLIAYTEELIKETVYQCQKGGSTLGDNIPQRLCSAYEHPHKETVVQEHRSRFTK